jgi:PEP-CTERM motif
MRNRLPRSAFIFVAVAAASLGMGPLVAQVHAGSVIFQTPSGSSTSGGPVDAEALFLTSPGILTITLFNREANPTDVAQNLSDLVFVGSGSLTGETLASSSSEVITVNADKTFNTGVTVATGWVFSASGATGTLDDLNGTGHAGPAHTLIGGPAVGGTYSNANNTIAGNTPNNPFLDQGAVFTITGSDITANTTITAVTFSFGTTSGINVVGQAVPEPSSLVLGMVGLGLVGTIGLYWTRRRS